MSISSNHVTGMRKQITHAGEGRLLVNTYPLHTCNFVHSHMHASMLAHKHTHSLTQVISKHTQLDKTASTRPYDLDDMTIMSWKILAGGECDVNMLSWENLAAGLSGVNLSWAFWLKAGMMVKTSWKVIRIIWLWERAFALSHYFSPCDCREAIVSKGLNYWSGLAPIGKAGTTCSRAWASLYNLGGFSTDRYSKG